MRLVRFAVPLLLTPAVALAQAGDLVDRPVTSGVLLPPTSVATVQGPLSLALQPSGLALAPAGFAYLHEEATATLAAARRADAVLFSTGGLVTGGDVAVSAGFGIEWLRPAGGGCSVRGPCLRRTSLGIASGTPAFSLGLAYRWFQSNESAFFDHLGTLDLGFTWRPASWLSFAGLWQALNQPQFGGRTAGRVLQLGLALRPGLDWITASADVRWDGSNGTDLTRLDYGLFVGPVGGIELGAQLSQSLDDFSRPVSLLLGLKLGFGSASLGGAGGGDVRGVAAGTGGNIYFEASGAKGPELFGPMPTAQVLDVKEALEGPNTISRLLGEDAGDPEAELALRLGRLARDPSVDTLVLEIRGLGDLSLGGIQELRGLVQDARVHGKHVIAWLESGGDAEYYLASAADKVWAAPQAMLLLNGFSSERTYLRGALDKLGIEPEFVKNGRYKSAPEQFTETHASDAAREEYESLLDDQFERYVAAIADARHFTPEAVKKLLDLGVFISDDAAREGLIDGVCTGGRGLDPAIEAVAGRKLARVKAGPEEEAPRAWGDVPAIAIVSVKGNILSGEGGPTAQVAGAARIVRELRRLADDSDVAAIVLRVDSPGGDVGGSELIYQAVLEAKKKKPVVASLGDVAASGGYYVAVAADEIIAEPGTITGSIGVFAGKANLAPLFEKLGITTETLRRGERADLFTLNRPWTPAERERIAAMVSGFYESFLQRVADGRKMSVDGVRAVAEGRVWTGAQAQSRKLVDSLGGLDLALRRARDRANLPASASVRVIGTTGLFELRDPAVPVGALAGAGPVGWQELVVRGLLGAPLVAGRPGRWEEGLGLVVEALVEGRPLALATELPVVR